MQPPPAVTYPLSLHDALPIFLKMGWARVASGTLGSRTLGGPSGGRELRARLPLTSPFGQHKWHSEPCPSDRKSRRLNSSHVAISYAVFCLKKKKTYKTDTSQ